MSGACPVAAPGRACWRGAVRARHSPVVSVAPTRPGRALVSTPPAPCTPRYRARRPVGRRVLSREPRCERPDGQRGDECGEVRFRHPASCHCVGSAGRRRGRPASPAPRSLTLPRAGHRGREAGHRPSRAGPVRRVAFPPSRRSTLIPGTLPWIPPSSIASRPACSSELSEFLSIPSVSALPAHAADCRRAAEWLRDELTRLGCPMVDAHRGRRAIPVVWAESPHVPGRPTLLIYGHYDVQPPDPLDEWVTPAVRAHRARRPALRPRGGRRQGPGLLPAQGVRGGARRRPAGRRSTCTSSSRARRSAAGSVISDLLRARAGADPGRRGPGLRHVVLRARDGPRSTPRSAASATPRSRSARCERDLHSGTYGGVAPNALETLVRHPRRAQGRGRRDPDPQALQGGRAADQAGAQDLEAAAVRQGALPRARRSPARR